LATSVALVQAFE